jgi:hypothetical protein
MIDIYDIEEIEKEVHQIADFACGHGTKSILNNSDYPITGSEFLEKIKASKTKFIINCHDGFKAAQTKIIFCIQIIQNEEDIVSKKLKEAKTKKDKESVKE